MAPLSLVVPAPLHRRELISRAVLAAWKPWLGGAGEDALWLSARVSGGLFGYCLILLGCGRTETNSNADSPGKLLCRLAVTREVRLAAPVGAAAVAVRAGIPSSAVVGHSAGVCGE